MFVLGMCMLFASACPPTRLARRFAVFALRPRARALLCASSCAALLPLSAWWRFLPPLAFCVRACVALLVPPRALRVFGRFRSSAPRARSPARPIAFAALWSSLFGFFLLPRAVCASRASCLFIERASQWRASLLLSGPTVSSGLSPFHCVLFSALAQQNLRSHDHWFHAVSSAAGLVRSQRRFLIAGVCIELRLIRLACGHL